MSETRTKSGLLRSDFNKEIEGKIYDLVTLTNQNGMEMTIMNQGAKIVSLMVPDKEGQLRDVVLGFDTLDQYLSTSEMYYGAICGRVANRMANGSFVLDGVSYDVPKNAGEHGLHGGIDAFHLKYWQMKQVDETTVDLQLISPDGDQGYPGNLTLNLRYTLTQDNELLCIYEATTDAPTIINVTQHSFFNLNGDGSGDILDHVVTIDADFFTPTDQFSIPTGEVRPLKGTPMDFKTAHTIRERIKENYEPLIFGKGNDHNYVLNKLHHNAYQLAATCWAPQSGILMEVFTTEPACQLYTSNWIPDGIEGKHGRIYNERGAICFEAQHFPDAIHHNHFPCTILRPSDTYRQTTAYKFSVKK